MTITVPMLSRICVNVLIFVNVYIGFEETPFTKLVFKTMDVNRDGQLNFEEFVICTWDFLSDELSHFAFRLFDKDKSGHLSRAEVAEMSQYIYGVKHGNHTLDGTIDRMKADSHGRVSMAEFRDQCRRNQSILWPAFVVQNTLRRSIMGEAYWKDVESKRSRNMPGKSVWDILKRTEEEVSDAEITLNFE